MRGAVGEDEPGGQGGMRALRSASESRGSPVVAAPPSQSDHSELWIRGVPRRPRVGYLFRL